jgi:MFS family permease
VFIATVAEVAIVPLLPQIASRTHFSALGSGALLAAPNLTMLLASIPSGLFADRIGTRTATRTGAVVLAVGAIGQGLARSFPLLLIMRLIVGAAAGILWTTSLAWLVELQSDRGAGFRPVAVTATSGGLGLVAGPALGALLARWVGPFTPNLIVGLCVIPSAIGVFVVDRGHPLAVAAASTDHIHPVNTDGLRRALGARAVIAGVVGLALSGLVAGTVNLLAPIELRRAGISDTSIGLAFSCAAGLYILATVLVVRFSDRLIRLSALAGTLVIMAAALAPASISVSVAAVAISLLALAPLRAVVATISYPLAAAVGGSRTGVAMGVLNGSWATAGVIGPTIAGALAQLGSPRLAFALLAAGSLLCGLLLVRNSHRTLKMTPDGLEANC